MQQILMVIFTFFTFSLFAQHHGGGGHKGGSEAKTQNNGEIFGEIKDSISNKPLAYITVLALNKTNDEVIGGAVTTENGHFSIVNLPLGEFKVKISFVGYTTKYVEGISLTKDQSTYNLKTISVSQTILDIVEVNGDVPEIRYEIDKKIISVEDQINTDGQSAIEILENVPSVSVAADGTVTLRGSSSFTLLIDGIPTIMNASDALATIPASTIKDIEIITNPSAKYDAEGTSGVINIITKKNKLEGVSCLVNLSAGRFDNYGGDVALNLKKNKFTFDINANYNSRSRPNETNTERISNYDSLTNSIFSEGVNNWKMRNMGIGGGMQWVPNNGHTLVIKTNVKSFLMTPYSDFNFTNYDNDSLIGSFYNEQHNNIDFINNTSSLFYQYNINRNKDHNISFKAISNITDVVQFDTTTSYNSDGSIQSGNLYTETGPSNSFRFNIDYHLGLKKERKFETGIQAQFGRSGDVGKNYIYNTTTTEYDFVPLFSSDVDYKRNVHAAYSMFSGKHKKIGYQLGLRAEYTFRTISSTAETDFTEINRLDWFPSAHFSYNLKKKRQLLVSYSRRIERPRSYYFEPFITWEGPFNVRTGNPNLTPEYINAFEVNFMQPIEKKGYFSLEGYYRKSAGIINRISSVYEAGILISQPYNIGTSDSYGLEAALSYKLTKWWKMDISSNTYFYSLAGELNEIDYSAESFNFSGRFTNTFKIKDFTLQFVTRYRSASASAQGESFDSFVQDISLKRSFLKKRLSMTLLGRNILGTAQRGSTSSTENVYLYSLSKPLSPQIMLSISMKFNNYQKVFSRNEQLDDF